MDSSFDENENTFSQREIICTKKYETYQFILTYVLKTNFFWSFFCLALLCPKKTSYLFSWVLYHKLRGKEKMVIWDPTIRALPSPLTSSQEVVGFPFSMFAAQLAYKCVPLCIASVDRREVNVKYHTGRRDWCYRILLKYIGSLCIFFVLYSNICIQAFSNEYS